MGTESPRETNNLPASLPQGEHVSFQTYLASELDKIRFEFDNKLKDWSSAEQEKVQIKEEKQRKEQEQKQKEIEFRQAAVESRQTTGEAQQKIIESKIDHLEFKIDHLDVRLGRVEEVIKTLENKVEERIKTLENKVEERVKTLENKVEGFRQEMKSDRKWIIATIIGMGGLIIGVIKLF